MAKLEFLLVMLVILRVGEVGRLVAKRAHLGRIQCVGFLSFPGLTRPSDSKQDAAASPLSDQCWWGPGGDLVPEGRQEAI